MKTVCSVLLVFIAVCFFNCSASPSRDAQIKLELGEEAFTGKRYDQAVDYFTQYLKTSPDDSDAHLKLGLALLKQHQLKEAVYHFKENIRLAPDDREAQSLMKTSMFDESLKLGREGEEEASMKYLTAYLTIEPDDVDSYLTLAKAFIRRGDRGNAIKCLNKLVSLDPHNPEVIALLDLFADGFH